MNSSPDNQHFNNRQREKGVQNFRTFTIAGKGVDLGSNIATLIYFYLFLPLDILPILVFSERPKVPSIDSLLVLLCMIELWEVFNDCNE